MKIAVFWVVAPCSLVEVYQRFRGPCCLHHQGDRTTQKAAIFAFPSLSFLLFIKFFSTADVSPSVPFGQ
jgi:hypothetical protein